MDGVEGFGGKSVKDFGSMEWWVWRNGVSIEMGDTSNVLML